MQGRPAEAVEDFKVLINKNYYYFDVWFMEWLFYKLQES